MLSDLVSLTLFLHAVKLKSITRAAEQSCLTLPAASRRIALLEQVHGAKLLFRSTRGVEPTPAGRALVQYAEEILKVDEALRRKLSEFSQANKGRVRIQASTSAITQTLPEDLAGFLATYPDVCIDLVENRSSRIADALRECATDIGVVVDGTDLTGLDYCHYTDDRLIALVPNDHILRQESIKFSQLVRYEFVGLDEETALTRLLTSAALDLGEPLILRVQVQSFEAVARLVQAGLGVSVLPEGPVIHLINTMGLRMIYIDEPWVVRKHFVAYRQLNALTVATRNLVTHFLKRQPCSK